MDSFDKKEEKFMLMALDEAHKALERDEVPIGAVVVCQDRVVARAHNLTQTLCDVTAHAEMQAITAAASSIGSKYLDKCTLYVTIEPCPMCASAAYWAQLGRVVYGASDLKRGYSVVAQGLLHPKTKVSKGLLEDQCATIMREFFQKKRL